MEIDIEEFNIPLNVSFFIKTGSNYINFTLDGQNKSLYCDSPSNRIKG